MRVRMRVKIKYQELSINHFVMGIDCFHGWILRSPQHKMSWNETESGNEGGK